MEGLAGHTRDYPSGVDLVHDGQLEPAAYVLREGWTCAYKMLSSGERLIIGFQIQGDILGLRTVLLGRSDHNIQPITKIRAAKLIKGSLTESFNTPSDLRALLRASALMNESMMIERLVSLGRRDATQRILLFLLECWSRLRKVGLADDTGYPCPLSQYHLADALGMSAVHVNRVLGKLRKDGVLTFRKGHVRFDDLAGALALTGFNPSYLDCGDVVR
ncbi:Crp/Fnr family transcriptional regulator [Jannaschia marina]|uniref:Crp/Fnr family transcriptional regulator n=1 Tax=Jannaschia marina TaxID=2741674 RepID=UPI0015C82BD1|nr:Crp/Fnr family transcriptional regulator [Jannaschia marina]